MILRSNLSRSVVVAGVVTQGCVDATLRDAVNAAYYVVACTDCSGSSGGGPFPTSHNKPLPTTVAVPATRALILMNSRRRR